MAIKTLIGARCAAIASGRELERLDELLSRCEELTEDELWDVEYSTYLVRARLEEVTAVVERLSAEGVPA